MPKVLNKKHGAKDGVYIGRPTKWGNPYMIGTHGNRAEVISQYENYLLTSPELMAALSELKGKNLICWCSPKPCHGDVLLKYANTLEND